VSTVRLERAVTTSVCDEIRRLAERFRTHATHVWLLTCSGCTDKQQTLSISFDWWPSFVTYLSTQSLQWVNHP